MQRSRGHRSSVVPYLTLVLTLGAALAAVGVGGGGVQHASAAPLDSACQIQPNHKNCDGQDPQGSGCANSGITVASVPLNDNGHQIGLVEMRWSTECGTNWTRVTSFLTGSGTVWLLAQLQSDNDTHIYTGTCWESGCPKNSNGDWIVWSAMYYAPSEPVMSCGGMQSNLTGHVVVNAWWNPGWVNSNGNTYWTCGS